jgi:hypothetical protein
VDTKVESARLIRDAGVPVTPVSLAASVTYIDRTRRARRYGIVLGLIAGFGPLASSSSGGSLVIPRMIAGYLLGLLASELFAPRPERPARRQALLRPRTPDDLISHRARWLPWLTLLPVVLAPLLLVGWHPRGRSHVTYPNHGGSCSAIASWPGSTYLFAVAGLAVVALAAWEVTLHRLAVRQQPAENPTMRSLDHAMRAHSARSAVAAASALGFVLLAQIASAVDDGVHSFLCTVPINGHFSVGNVYSWGGSADPWLSNATFTFLVLAVVTFLLCRRMRTPAVSDRLASP